MSTNKQALVTRGPRPYRLRPLREGEQLTDEDGNAVASGSTMIFKGDIDTVEDYPAADDRRTGDVYRVTASLEDPVTEDTIPAGTVVMWQDTDWIVLYAAP